MKGVVYKGFGIRFIAFLIDTIIFYLIYLATNFLMILSPLSLFKGVLINIGINCLLFALYEIYLTHRFGGTVGKLLLDVKVINKEGIHLSLIDSVLRYVSKWISYLTLGFGYLMILWDSDKQGLHDKIAGTYVIDKPKPRISKNLKRVLIIATLLILIGYVMLTTFLFITGFVMGMNTVRNPLNVDEPLNHIDVFCGSKINMVNDLCIYAYSGQEPIISLDSEIRLGICSKIKSRSLQTECIQKIAIYYNDVSICEKIETTYYQKLCKKTYEFNIEVQNYFFRSEEIELKGELSEGEILVGIYDEDFIELSTPIFTKEDTAVFEIVNFSGFKKGRDGSYDYKINVRIFNETGSLIKFTNDLAYGMGGLQLTNATLEKDYVFSEIYGLEPGNYTYEFTVYDPDTFNGSRINKTITVIERRESGLVVGEVTVGIHLSFLTQFIQTKRLRRFNF